MEKGVIMSNIPDNVYWETYDDQSSSDFARLMYTNLEGNTITEDVKEDLAQQVRNIRRCNGQATEIILLEA